jgi:hypothetical protein
MQITLDRVANLLLIVTCVVVLGLVASSRYGSGSSAKALPELPFKVGDQMSDVPGVAFGDSPVTLVLYVKSTCMYCTDSMPFYRRLAGLDLKRKGVLRIVFASSEPSDTVTNYLQHNGLLAIC